MEVWLYKRCPKCKGDLLVDGEGFDRRVTCIQCGYEEYEGQEYTRPDVRELVLPSLGATGRSRTS